MLAIQSENELLTLAQLGDHEAQELLLEKYSRMIWKLAQKRCPPSEDVEDFAQNGRVAFVTYLKKFDATKGASFFTYIYRCVDGQLLSARRNCGTIRIPSHLNRSDERFASVTKLVGLDFADEQGKSFASQLADPSANHVEEIQEREEFGTLSAAVDSLPVTQRRVVRGRLDGRSLADIGDELGISKERVRQIEEVAHKNLPRLVARAKRGRKLRTGLAWASEEINFIRQQHCTRTVVSIATELNRPYTSVVALATSLGLKKKPLWTTNEDDFLRDHREKGWPWCAQQLNRGVIGIYNRVRRLGIQNKMLSGGDYQTVKRLHLEGRSTTEIGLVLGMSGECIRMNLRKMLLSSGNRDEEKRMRTLRDTLMTKYGVDNPSAVRSKLRRDQAGSLGWGEIDLRYAVVLESLKRIGRPADRSELAAERVKLGAERGWKFAPTWHPILQATKWLADNGFITKQSRSLGQGRGAMLCLFWFTEKYSHKNGATDEPRAARDGVRLGFLPEATDESWAAKVKEMGLT